MTKADQHRAYVRTQNMMYSATEIKGELQKLSNDECLPQQVRDRTGDLMKLIDQLHEGSNSLQTSLLSYPTDGPEIKPQFTRELPEEPTTKSFGLFLNDES